MRILSTKTGLGLVFSMLVAAGCGGDDSDLPEVDCDGDVPTYAEVTVFQSVCTDCHSSQVTGADRQNAPVAINFDTYAAAKSSAESAVAAVYSGTMPPGGGVSEADKQKLYTWGLCGTPE